MVLEACENCGSEVNTEKIKTHVRLEYGKKMRIDDIVYMPLPGEEEDDDDDDDDGFDEEVYKEMVGDLCGKCHQDFTKTLEKMIEEEKELGKQYERYLKQNFDDDDDDDNSIVIVGNKQEKEVEIPMEQQITIEQHNGNNGTEESGNVCADQSRSPVPDKVQNVNNKEDEYRKLLAEYNEQKKVLEDIYREKKKMEVENNKRLEWDIAFNNYLMDVSEQNDKDEAAIYEKEATKYKLEELKKMRAFYFDEETHSINGYKIDNIDNPFEVRAAIGICVHMLYNIHKMNGGARKNSSLNPQGPYSSIFIIKNIDGKQVYGEDPDISFEVPGTMLFRDEKQRQEEAQRKRLEQEQKPQQQKSGFSLSSFFGGGSKIQQESQQYSNPSKSQIKISMREQKQNAFEKGMSLLYKEYFFPFCNVELSLIPSELTREQWKQNMCQFLSITYAKWAEVIRLNLR